MANLTINDACAYTVQEVAKRLNMAPAGVRRLIARGHLLAGRAGRKYMILGSNIRRFLSKNQRTYERNGPDEK